MDRQNFKTPCQVEREARDLEIYNEYNSLTSDGSKSKVMVKEFLCKKYGIHSQGTIYVILKRVEQRLQEEAAL